VLLDLDQETALGTGWESTEEHSVVIAASLAAQELEAEHPVGLAINGSEPSWTVPRRNEYQLKALLKELAVASPASIGVQDYLHRIGPSLGSHSSLLIVTANAHPEWTASLVPLMWRGIQPTVFLLDPISFSGSTDTRPINNSLQVMGIPCHIIPREMLDKQQLWPGSEGEWEWRVVGTGKAIAVRKPVADWRKLE
jgi:uncharacterized protein (DUF58 family)